MRIINENTSDKTIELISLVLTGNERAVAGFYNMLLPFIISVIRKQAFQLNGTNTNELAHDILVKTYYRLDKYDTSKPLFPWVSIIVRNHLIDLYRKHKTEKLQSLDVIVENNSYKEIKSLIRIQNPSPEEQIIHKELTSELYSIIDRLPPKDKELFTGFYLEGKSLKTLTKELSFSSTNAVSIRLFRSRQKLKNFIK